MDTASVQLLQQIPLAVAAMIACGVLWRAYKAAHDEHIKDLRSALTSVNTRLLLIEDKMDMPKFDSTTPFMSETKFPKGKEVVE
jgi:hypothetical protein